MSDYSNKNIIITGGSSGIGLAVAKEFAQKGANLFLLARNPQKLENAKAELTSKYNASLVEIYPTDVAKEESVNKVVQEIGTKYGSIHIVILNAGIGLHGRFEQVSMGELRNIMDVNYWGKVNVLKAALPYMQNTKGAQVGIVSSVGGYVGFFGFSGYTPTKAALIGWAECLRMELDMPITIVYPPDTDTPLMQVEYPYDVPEVRMISANAKIIPAEEVAQKFIKGMEKGKFEVYCNFQSRLIRFVRGVWPGYLFRELDSILRKVRKQ